MAHVNRSLRKRSLARARAVTATMLALGCAVLLLIPRTVRLDALDALDAPDAVAIKDAQIVTAAGKTISKGTVVIRNGLIVDVGENVKIPGDARVIDGQGLTVYPGIIDGFTSLGISAPAAAQPAPGGGGGRQAAIAAAAAGQQPNPEAAHGDPSS